jgi:hypothetical protein
MALAGPVGHMDDAHEAGIPLRGFWDVAREGAPDGLHIGLSARPVNGLREPFVSSCRAS